MKVCLIGSGSLALGLVYPWLSRIADCEISLVTREGKAGTWSSLLAQARAYTLVLRGEELRQELQRPLLSYDPADLEAGPARLCMECLAASDVAVVSVGVGNLTAVARLIARSCTLASENPLHLFAFENTSQASERLRRRVTSELQRLGAGGNDARTVRAHTAIADRACDRRKRDGSVSVHIERFGEILLEETAAELFQRAEPSSPAPRVEFFSSDGTELAELRKFWLVNGTHTALGILCSIANLQLLNHGLEDERIFRFLKAIHAEWTRVLHSLAEHQAREEGLFTLDALAEHAGSLFSRLEDLPDFSVRNVLRELTVPKDYRGAAEAFARLLQKLDDRLGQQVCRASEISSDPMPFSALILARGVAVARQQADLVLRGA